MFGSSQMSHSFFVGIEHVLVRSSSVLSEVILGKKYLYVNMTVLKCSLKYLLGIFI